MNKSQVLESISHTYGITSNSESYLEKFIDFTVYLTPELTGREGNEVPQADYAYYLAERSFKEINEDNMATWVADFCALLAIRHGMGFREIDRFVDKCLTAYISYGNEGSSCSVELLAFSVVANTFLSIYSPERLKANIDGPFSIVNSVSKLVCDLLIRGAPDSSGKQISSLREPADREEMYNARIFYGFSVYLYNKNSRNNSNRALSGLSNYISNNFEPEEVVSSFNYWQSHLRSMS